jgi:hypothetical protein
VQSQNQDCMRSQHTKETIAGPFHFLHWGPMSDVTILRRLCVADFGHVMPSLSINLKILFSKYCLFTEYTYRENCDIQILWMFIKNTVHVYTNLDNLYLKSRPPQ